MLVRSEFRVMPVTLYGLFWNIVVSFCLVFSLAERRRAERVGDGLSHCTAARFSYDTLS